MHQNEQWLIEKYERKRWHMSGKGKVRGKGDQIDTVNNLSCIHVKKIGHPIK